MLYHQTDHGKLFLMNNLIKLRSHRDNQFDIAIADPPYGIGEDGANKDIKEVYFVNTWN